MLNVVGAGHVQASLTKVGRGRLKHSPIKLLLGQVATRTTRGLPPGQIAEEESGGKQAIGRVVQRDQVPASVTETPSVVGCSAINA